MSGAMTSPTELHAQLLHQFSHGGGHERVCGAMAHREASTGVGANDGSWYIVYRVSKQT